MTLRPAPGEQLSSGRLRVDATKAIAKLREYQLVDRTAWILEAIRAAVAAGATHIDLQGDSNDVWLSWSGEPWPADDLPRLFDELVSPEPGAARHHVRLLAAAVNSALGAHPAYVDVYTVGEASAIRARYTPDVLEAPAGDLEESPLRRVRAEDAGIPPGAPRGMHVHFRRRASLEVVSYWLRRADPPELVMARSACANIAVPIRIGDAVFDRAASHGDVVRVPLGNDVDGWVAITDTTLAPPIGREVTLAIAERGVLLETTSIELGIPEVAAPVPVRVFVDAPRMPTNASRSEVRRDAHPIPMARRRAKELVPELVAKLVEKCRGGEADPRARHAALHLLGAVIQPLRLRRRVGVFGSDWAARARELPPLLRALAELPLVRDAAGVPRPVAWEWSGLVHAGAKPLPEELAPWLSHVLWSPPGDPTAAITTWHIDVLALDDHLRRAKRERRAEKKFFKHAPRAPQVLGRRKPRVRARLGAPLAGSCIPDATFANLAGEICVYRERPEGELIVMLGGREIETVHFDSTIPFAAVIDGDRVTPTDRYRGVARDAAYAHVERAMRAGVVRAVEAVALAHRQTFVDGYQVATGGNEVVDAPLIRQALWLARNLDAPLGDVLAHARIWRTTDGLYSTAELREHAVLGVVPAYATVQPLAGRLVVHVDDVERAALAELTGARLVAYEASALDARIVPEELAVQLTSGSPHTLAFADGDLVAAMFPAGEPQLLLYHRGRRLAAWTYTPTLAPCTIAIDCDRLVPNPDWTDVADDAGLGTRDYVPWEHALARAAVEAILGERSQELIGGARVEPGSTLGRWLCISLLAHPAPEIVLGDELLTRLRLAALFRVLGDPRPYSVDELAVRFPDTILFVEHATDPVEGFPVVVADTIVARTIARLANRRSRNAADELATRRTQLARELRLGMHRAKPVQPIEVAGTHVGLHDTLGHGVVGVGRDHFELQILVEGRPFQTITRAHGSPFACVFELQDLTRTDAQFEHLAPGIDELLVAAVHGRGPDLLRAIAEQFPEALADAGPRRALFARHVQNHELAVDVREALARAIQFPTIQGGRATLLAARSGPLIQVSTWSGEWLGPDGDDHALDRPVLLTAGAPELDIILNALGGVVDVTPAVERLQAQRRIARGLLPTPKVTGADPELVKQLTDLGATFRHLGPGEVALVGGESEILLHVHGELRERVPVECVPAIQLAIEAADLVGDRSGLVERRLGDDARELAVLLVRRILLGRPADTLPFAIRRSLRRAILAGRLPDLRTAPVFETATGAWIDLAAVQAQRELFGNLWCVAEVPADATPLDERRVVLVLSAAQQALAIAHGIPVVEATGELVLDAKTRRNRARPPAAALAIDEPGIIARVELDGDGVTAPRGSVAILAPAAAHRRQLRLHRAMHPFDVTTDPCRWPTVAAIDDARFTPDRCWEHPERDDVYKAAIDALHRASNDALRTTAPPPATALASIRVAPWTYDSVTLLRAGDIQIRGTLWLDGPPVTDVAPTIRVVEQHGESTFVPLRGIGLAGTLYVHGPRSWEREAVLESLAKGLHAKLVRELALTRRREVDQVAAHVAWALALERIKPEDARHVSFTCFRPGPIDAAQLSAILMASAPVVAITPESTYDGSAFVDDGSETARVVKTWLGSRLRAPGAARRRPDTVEPPPRPVVDHPLQPAVNRLHARITALGVQVPQWRLVDDRDEPLAQYDGGVLELAAANRHVVATAAALAANTAWAADALDALAAHCITVLNIALTSITDATEARAIGKLLE